MPLTVAQLEQLVRRNQTLSSAQNASYETKLASYETKIASYETKLAAVTKDLDDIRMQQDIVVFRSVVFTAEVALLIEYSGLSPDWMEDNAITSYRQAEVWVSSHKKVNLGYDKLKSALPTALSDIRKYMTDKQRNNIRSVGNLAVHPDIRVHYTVEKLVLMANRAFPKELLGRDGAVTVTASVDDAKSAVRLYAAAHKLPVPAPSMPAKPKVQKGPASSRNAAGVPCRPNAVPAHKAASVIVKQGPKAKKHR